jgi:hypothetical protein
MRISILLSLIVLAACTPMRGGRGRSSVGVSVGIQLGPERPISYYSREQHGDWRVNYQQWQPTTVYVVDGRFYDNETRGARAVVVYRRNNEYFLPPQEKEWVGKDKRYDYKHKPKDEDYNRGRGKP